MSFLQENIAKTMNFSNPVNTPLSSLNMNRTAMNFANTFSNSMNPRHTFTNNNMNQHLNMTGFPTHTFTHQTSNNFNTSKLMRP